ncbi:unnamed protein product, partial [Polarella glacialis]
AVSAKHNCAVCSWNVVHLPTARRQNVARHAGPPCKLNGVQEIDEVKRSGIKRKTQLHQSRLRRRPQAPRALLSAVGALGLSGLGLRRWLRASARPQRPSFRVNGRKAPADLLQRQFDCPSASVKQVGCWSNLDLPCLFGLRGDGWCLSPVPWSLDGFFVEAPPRLGAALGHSRAHLTGQLYVQESTSMLPVEVLMAALSKEGIGLQGLRVLDVCSAPGSKTTQLAARLPESALIVANELNTGRFRILRTNLLLAGAENCLPLNLDGRSLGGLAPGSFDAVLLDAPCSGEGNIRKDPDSWDHWAADSDREASQGPPPHLLALQQELLESAWQALRPGGILVYSTCTLGAAENEAQCGWLLESRAGDVSALQAPELLGLPAKCFSLPDKHAVSEDSSSHLLGKQDCLRVWSQVVDTEGFFVSCFRKEAAAPRSTTSPSAVTASGRLLPLQADEVRRLRQKAIAELGFWPGGTDLHEGDDGTAVSRLVEDAEGFIWLLPPGAFTPSLRLLAEQSSHPGVQLARRQAGGSFSVYLTMADLSLSDELLLLAGDRASVAAAGMSEGDWVALAARVERSRNKMNHEMDTLASHGDVTAAEQLLATMRGQRLKPDLVTHTTLLKARCVRATAADLKQAEHGLEEMVAMSLLPDLVAYNLVLEAYARKGDLPGTKRVSSMIQKQGLVLDMIAYNTLLGARASRGDTEGAEKLLEEARQQRLSPDVVSYNILLDAHARRPVVDLKAARRVFDSIRSAGLNPDSFSYAILVKAQAVMPSAAAGPRLAQESRALLAELRAELGAAPSLQCANAFIHALAKGGDAPAAEELLLEIRTRAAAHQGPPPNVVSFNSLLSAVARQGDAQAARRLFSELRSARLAPDIVSFHSLLGLEARAGNGAAAEALLSELRSERLGVDAKAYNLALQAFASGGPSGGPPPGGDGAMKAAAAAGRLLEAMGRDRVEIGARATSLVMRLRARAGDLQGSEEAMQTLRSSRLQPDLSCYNSLLDAYAKRGDLLQVEALVQTLRTEAVDKEPGGEVLVLTLLSKARANAGDLAGAEQLLEELQSRGLQPHPSGFATLLRAREAEKRRGIQ